MSNNFTLKLALALIAVAAWQAPCRALDYDFITPKLLDPHRGGTGVLFHGVLVHGRVDVVEKPKKDEDRIPARIVITHVYWGNLPDKTTSVTDYSLPPNFSGSTSGGEREPFEVGEEGLWLLLRGADGSLGVRACFRKTQRERYAQFVEQAKFLESVWPLDGEKRFDLALRNLRHATPEVAMSAAHIAVDRNPSRALRELFKQAESAAGLAVPTQMAFDHAFLSRYDDVWGEDDRRLKLIASWPREARDEETLNFLVSATLDRRRHRMPAPLAAAVIAAVMVNEKNPKAARLHAIEKSRHLPRSADVVDTMFDSLTGVLRNSKDAKLRLAAAEQLSGILGHIPKSDPIPTCLRRVEYVRLVRMQRDEADPKVKKSLADAIAEAEATRARLKIDD